MESNEREYMREVFQNQLSDVQGRLVEMAESVTTIMEKASKAFLNSDVALADEAIALAEANENRA
ncbi:MAG: phosphate signaling complex protein PhoU, partial [Actinomycetota bacterium]